MTFGTLFSSDLLSHALRVISIKAEYQVPDTLRPDAAEKKHSRIYFCGLSQSIWFMHLKRTHHRARPRSIKGIPKHVLLNSSSLCPFSSISLSHPAPPPPFCFLPLFPCTVGGVVAGSLSRPLLCLLHLCSPSFCSLPFWLPRRATPFFSFPARVFRRCAALCLPVLFHSR